MKNILTLSILLPAISPMLEAATVFHDFETTDEFTNNFTGSKNGRLSQTDDSGNGIVRLPSRGSGTDSGAFLGTGASTTWDTYLEESLKVDVRFASFTSTSATLHARSISDGTGDGISGKISALAGDSITFELKNGSHTSGTAGSAFYSNTFTLAANTINTGVWYTLQLDQTSGADPQFQLTLFNGSTTIATSGQQSFTGNDDFNSAGFVAFGGNSGGGVVDFDNFTVVPEPSSAALLFGAMSAGMLLRRRSAK